MTVSSDPAAVAGVGIGVIPKQQRGIEVRDRLLEAAIREIDQRGIEESRVENIVAEAETSWGTFFRYFPRKEDVFLLESAREFRTYVRPVFEHRTEDGRSYEAVAADMFAEMMEPRVSPRFHAEMISETVAHPIRFAAILGDGELPLVALAAQLIAEAQQSGQVRSDVPAHIGAAVLTAGVVFSTAHVLRAVAAGFVTYEEVGVARDNAFKIAWDGLRPG